jgi:probable O-glycosylation ligase (exosortase A-associated)
MSSLALAIVIFASLPVMFVEPFIGVLMWSWVSFMSPMRLIYGIADAIPFALVIGVTCIAGWLFGGRRRVPLDATMVLIAAFMVVYTISTFFALDPTPAWEKWLETTKAFVFFFVTAALLTNRIRVHALVWIMAISVGFYGVKGGIFALLTGGNYRIWGPPATVIGDNNHIACALVVLLPMMNYLALQSERRVIVIGARVAMGLCVLAVLASYSRGAFLALGAMVVFLWLHSRHKILTAMMIVPVLALSIHFMPDKWTERISTLETYDQDRSATGRLDIWRASAKIALARPFVGGGFRAPYNQEIVNRYDPGTEARAVHSIWFEVMGETGLVGFGLWVAILGLAFINCRIILRRTAEAPELRWANDLSRMLLASLIGFAVGGTFLSLSYWDFYFTLVVILASVRRIVAAELAPQSREAAVVRAPAYGRTRPASLALPVERSS